MLAYAAAPRPRHVMTPAKVARDARCAELAQLITTGNPEAFAQLVKITYGIVDRELDDHGIHNFLDREDLVQEVFATFWRKRYQWDVNRPVAYLIGTARKMAMKHRWANERRPDILLRDPRLEKFIHVDPAPSPEAAMLEAVEGEETERHLSEVLDRLPDPLSAVLRARMQGMNPDQIAEDLGISLLQAWDRTLKGLSSVKELAGLPLADPALEQRMKDCGLWPKDAHPLSGDIGQTILALPEIHRITAYARLSGIKQKDILQVWGVKVPTFTKRLQNLRRELWIHAKKVGAIPADQRPYWWP